jgi:hypothetical protein
MRRWCCARTRSRASRRWTAPRRSCRCWPGSPAPQPRLRPPWHHQPVRGAGGGKRQGDFPDDPAAPPDRVHAVPGPHRPSRARRAGRAPDRGELLHPQEAGHPALAGGSSPLPHALHPTYSSWLNLVERWFAELTNKWLRRGTHRSVGELIARSRPGSTPGTRSLARLCGPRPPTRSSRTSLGISSESLTQDPRMGVARLRRSRPRRPP